MGFRYAPDKPEAVSGVDLTVEHGTSTALVGPSGAGKSTLVALLMRFHAAGRINLGGVDIAKADPSALQAQISLVSQDVHLFKDTLRANLLSSFWRKTASMRGSGARRKTPWAGAFADTGFR